MVIGQKVKTPKGEFEVVGIVMSAGTAVDLNKFPYKCFMTDLKAVEVRKTGGNHPIVSVPGAEWEQKELNGDVEYLLPNSDEAKEERWGY